MSIFRRGRPSRKDPPNGPGIYRFRNKLTREIDYIGEAVDIARRIAQHLRSSKILSLDTHHVEWQAADGRSTSRTRREHERDKINKHKPRLNKRGGGGGRESQPIVCNTTDALKYKEVPRGGDFSMFTLLKICLPILIATTLEVIENWSDIKK